MQMEGVEAKELSALHGSLMAFDWIEQNTGQALMLANGTLSACYRITLSGLQGACPPLKLDLRFDVVRAFILQ